MNGNTIVRNGVFVFLLIISRTAFADADINEGELHFLTQAPAQEPHRYSKKLILTADSLKTGWVQNRQCHYRLDQVAAMEIVFGKGRVRNLKVLEARNIEKAWIEADSVQLKNVGADARLCIASENRIVKRDDANGDYLVSSGPYMRRFLDGYFPMQVNLEIEYPKTLIHLVDISPTELNAHLENSPGRLAVNALFEGRLDIVLRFAAATASTPVTLPTTK